MLLVCPEAPSPAEVCLPFAPARQDLTGLFKPVESVAGDFDEDGTSDLAVISAETPGDILHGEVHMLIADSAGGLVPGPSVLLDRAPDAASAADFDGDLHLDLAVIHTLDRKLTILFGDGSGGFPSSGTLTVPGDPIAVAAVEFTGDYAKDLLVLTTPITFPGKLHVFQGVGDGTFTLLTTATVGVGARSLAVGRFNADAVLDAAVGNDSSVSILLGAGGGGLGAPSTIPLSVAGGVNSLAPGDFDNDSKIDLAAATEQADQGVVVLLGNGAGGFTPQPGIAMGSDVDSLALCDFNRDGKRDLLAAKFGADAVSILMGRGDGAFDPPVDLGANARPIHVVTSELNHDGFCDAVSVNRSADSVSVFLGDGFGSLGAPRYGVPPGPIDVVVADFNRDGKPDVVTANRNAGAAQVLLGLGEGNFATGAVLAAGTSPGAVAVADLSGDGFLDVAIANQGSGGQQADTVTVRFGDGFGSFPFTTTLTVDHLPLDVAAGDFDRDGIADLAVANAQSDTVTILLSRGGGAFNNGRSFRTGDYPASLAVLDVDADGILDLAVSLLLGNAVGFMMGNANGSFSESPLTLPGGGSNTDDLIAEDVNGDGRKDLLWIDHTFANEPAKISIWLGDGGSWFVQAPSSGLETGTFGEKVAVLDLDRAGGIDLAAVSRFDDSVRVWLGDGDGGFIYQGDFGCGREPFALAAADFNRDARMDLVTADFTGQSVSVLLNNTFIDPGFDTLHAVDQSMFTWDPVPDASVYKVYRGFATDLPQKDYGACYQNNVVSAFADITNPPVGQAYFYVVTPVIGGEEQLMGLTTGCVKRVNRTPCPF